MQFKYKLMTQTQLGQLFGVSSHKIGQWLIDAGLRTEKRRPSDKAHQGGFCKTGPSGVNGYHWVWNSEKTVRALQDAGHTMSADAPSELVRPSPLNGPFVLGGSHQILNADGSVAVVAVNDESALIVLKLLNTAHRHGVIDRMTGRANVPLPTILSF